jgi:hypothetical protein
MIVKCEKCGTDSPNVLFYVGEDSTHCVDCWSVIVKAHPNFNLDNLNAQLDEKYGTPENPLHHVSLNRLPAIYKVEPLAAHYNTGVDH